MYRRQLLSNLILIFFCVTLLGTGFFSLYYQHHLSELKKNVQRDMEIIRNYTKTVLKDRSDIYSLHFQSYLGSVAAISDATIFLCEADGAIIFYAGSNLDPARLKNAHIPQWAVRDALGENIDSIGLTTLGLLPQSSYVTGDPIIATTTLFDQNGMVIDRLEETVGLIFIGIDVSSVREFLWSALQMFFLTATAVLLLTMVISSLTAQYLVYPLRSMASAANRFARGEFDARVEDFSERCDEIAELAAAFNNMASSLAQSESRRSDFVANVSHELKTPMTTIAGFSDGILDGTVPPERQREALQIISSETRRLSRLVRRMLELSRLQSQERVAAQLQFDVSEVLLRVLLSLEASVTAKALEVVTDMPEEGTMVWGEPDAVTQVCYNLLDNAIKFSKEGGVLTLRIRSQKGKAYITIQNQGETIPPEQLETIFDRFHKTDSSRTSKDGVGLGLYIVKAILNTYQEDITVRSEAGETSFTFTLSEV